MVISHKYKCIFIKIPKTAGTAIYRFFESHDPESIRSDLSQWPWGHRTAAEVRNDPEVAPYWDSYFKFAFIREPTKWLVSLYNYEHGFDYSKDRYSSIHSVLADYDGSRRLRIPDNYCLNVFDIFSLMFLCREMMNYTIPQTPYLDAPLDFVGIYENIDQDFEFIKKITGIPSQLLLTKENVTDCSYPLTFNERAKKIIDIVLSEDIEYYNSMYEKLNNPHERNMGAFSFTGGWGVY